MSENAAASAAVSSVVEGLLAREEEEEERREESLQNTATRLAEDLAQVHGLESAAVQLLHSMTTFLCNHSIWLCYSLSTLCAIIPMLFLAGDKQQGDRDGW